MQFKDGAGVYTFDGHHVGHVDRVILNPQNKEVTDIVVRKGFLFAEDKIVPLRLIASATEDRITLNEDAGKLDELLPFEELHYIPLNEADLHDTAYPIGSASALYWYPPMGGAVRSPGADYAAFRTETVQNIPQGTLALNDGAKVFSDNNQHIGNVARVFTESPGNRATHFLVSEGIFFKVKKLIPVSWIREIRADEIHLNVGTAILDKLHEYQEA